MEQQHERAAGGQQLLPGELRTGYTSGTGVAPLLPGGATGGYSMAAGVSDCPPILIVLHHHTAYVIQTAVP